MFDKLVKAKSNFILSTWHHNDFRKNEYIEVLWNTFNICTQKHFYHVGANEKNRNPMVEAIITNFHVNEIRVINKKSESPKQTTLPGLL